MVTGPSPLSISAESSHIVALTWALRRLDDLLTAAFARFETERAEERPEPTGNLFVLAEEAARLLDTDADGDLAGDTPPLAPPDEGSRLADLSRRFALSPLEGSLLLIALAPELERRYERIYGYLQDDMSRRRATVGFALELLLPNLEERLAARRLLAPKAPLLAQRLLRLVEDPQDHQPPLHARELKVEERIVDYLLGSDAPDARVLSFARLVSPVRRLDELLLPDELRGRLAGLPRHRTRPVVYLRGPYGAGKETLTGAVALELGYGALLAVDGSRVPTDDPAFAGALGLLQREATLQGALIYWGHADELQPDERRARRDAVLRELAGAGPLILGGEEPWHPADLPDGHRFLALDLPLPGAAERAALWSRALREGSSAPSAAAVEELPTIANAFRLTPGQIRDAAAAAGTLANWRDPDAPLLGATDLYTASRAQSSPQLSTLASKVRVGHGWHDLVLPDEQQQQLRELCGRMRHQTLVNEGWGFGLRLALGGGLSALFSGTSGTGKTMAAGVIADTLGLDLYKIDLSLVVSKYIGETEKNLGRIFDEAARSSAVLFFDEADALFGKRSEVQDAHDRYANIEVGYLLQKLEEYEGLVILATNLRKNIDAAFIRRLDFIVEFPLPGATERRRIWEQIWPRELPRDPALDLGQAAQRWDLPGGNIRNIALAAAYLAAEEGRAVTMAHLAHAARREYRKLGRVAAEGAFAP